MLNLICIVLRPKGSSVSSKRGSSILTRNKNYFKTISGSFFFPELNACKMSSDEHEKKTLKTLLVIINDPIYDLQ